MLGYDASFANAAADQLRANQVAREYAMAGANQIGGLAAGVTSPARERIVNGINIEFLANGFLVSPRSDYLGSIHRTAHVARDKDELLKLVGEMIVAHAD